MTAKFSFIQQNKKQDIVVYNEKVFRNIFGKESGLFSAFSIFSLMEKLIFVVYVS